MQGNSKLYIQNCGHKRLGSQSFPSLYISSKFYEILSISVIIKMTGVNCNKLLRICFKWLQSSNQYSTHFELKNFFWLTFLLNTLAPYNIIRITSELYSKVWSNYIINFPILCLPYIIWRLVNSKLSLQITNKYLK